MSGEPAPFTAGGDAYERYMGGWSRPLGRAFVDAVGVGSGDRVLDVGCGTGALTVALVDCVGTSGVVAAVDPSEQQVSACAATAPSAEVRVAGAEAVPFEDGTFDGALAQLVVNFLADPAAGVREMRRVVRPGGKLAACTWDYGEGMTMLRAFWDAATAVDPAAPHEGRTMPYCTAVELERLWLDAGLADVTTGSLTVTREYEGFDELWGTFALGVGPGGAFYAGLDLDERDRLRGEYFRQLGEPEGRLSLNARAWLVQGSRAA